MRGTDVPWVRNIGGIKNEKSKIFGAEKYWVTRLMYDDFNLEPF